MTDDRKRAEVFADFLEFRDPILKIKEMMDKGYRIAFGFTPDRKEGKYQLKVEVERGMGTGEYYQLSKQEGDVFDDVVHEVVIEVEETISKPFSLHGAWTKAECISGQIQTTSQEDYVNTPLLVTFTMAQPGMANIVAFVLEGAYVNEESWEPCYEVAIFLDGALLIIDDEKGTLQPYQMQEHRMFRTLHMNAGPHVVTVSYKRKKTAPPHLRTFLEMTPKDPGVLEVRM